MKGLELPLNMIVVIAIAVLVLTVVAVFFTSNVGGGLSKIDLESARSQGCIDLQSSYGCSASGLPRISLRVGTAQTLMSLYDVCNKLGIGEDSDGVTGLSGIEITNGCLRRCGCPSADEQAGTP